MYGSQKYTVMAGLTLFCCMARAEEVDLPVPFLEWSVYVLLLFGLVVAIGIFIHRNKGEQSEPLEKLMEERRAEVHYVSPELSVTECVRQMNELKIGAMLGGGLDPTATQVSEVMSPDPICVTPTTSLEEARALVTTKRIRHLPVVDGGKVVGMVSSGDLTHWLVRDQSVRIGDL